MQVELLRPGPQRADVLWQAAAAEPYSRPQEPMPDAFVESQGSGELDDVGAGGVAGLGHRVDEGDLRCKEGVRRDLDELGCGEVHRQAGDARGEERGVALVEGVTARAPVRFLG